MPEKHIQNLFDLVWCGTNFYVSKEGNNGCGPYDFNITKGKSDQTVIEIKLAGNKRLKHVFEQINQYAKSAEAKNKIVLVVGCSDEDFDRFNQLVDLADLKNELDVRLFYIDCRERKSASKL